MISTCGWRPLPAGRDPGRSGRVRRDRPAPPGRSRSESSVPLLQFRLERELDQHRLDEPEARGRAIRAAAAIVARHPDAVTRHEYAVFLSRKTGVDLPVIEQAVSRAARIGRAGGRPGAGRGLPLARVGSRTSRAGVPSPHAGQRCEPGRSRSRAGGVRRPEAPGGVRVAVAPSSTSSSPTRFPSSDRVIGDDSGEVAALLRHLAMVDRPLAAGR